MSLTDTVIRNAKHDPAKKITTIQDERGMYLLITKSNQKYFRLDYRFAGKRKTLALGVYPETTLKEAREKRDEARRLIQDGVDPSVLRKAKKLNLVEEYNNTFRIVAEKWFETRKSAWSELHATRKWQLLEKNVFPILEDRPITSITPRELLFALNKMQERGVIETAHRARSTCGEIFRYGIQTGVCERDPSQDLKGALISMPAQKHRATITDPKEIGGLLRAIDVYNGDTVTRAALKLTPYVMLRPGELRNGEWSEVDFERKQWKIPASKMKMKRVHIVPLSDQAIAILKDIQQVTGKWKYIFPS